jgi:HlyD family secretion protein
VQQAQHNLDEARATAANDKVTLERTRELFNQGVVSKQALDDATAKHQADQQRANSLEQTFALSKLGPRAEEIARARGALMQAEGQAAYAKSQLDATQVRAPVSGTILERKAEKGELITAQFASGAEGGPQGSVVALADLNDLQVELDIAQGDFARLKPKQRGTVTVDAFPNLKWDGVVAEMSPEANRQKATVQVKVQILKPDDHLRPDMNANVKFLADENKNGDNGSSGAVVPASAVRDHDGKKVVFLALDGKAVMKEVRILEQRSNAYLVDGPINGENVITNGPESLKDGQSIKIKGKSS